MRNMYLCIFFYKKAPRMQDIKMNWSKQFFVKVHRFWEGHKIWRNHPPFLDITTSKKKVWFRQMFVVFLETLNYFICNLPLLLSPCLLKPTTIASIIFKKKNVFSENLCKKTVPSPCCGGVDRLESTHTKQMDRISLALISSTLKAQKCHKIDT